MVVRPSIGPLGDATKSIKVQLSLEGWEFGLSKVFGHYFGGEHLGFANDEAAAVGEPGYDGGLVYDIVAGIARGGGCGR